MWKPNTHIETYIVPFWLNGMPDEWMDDYFELSISHAICLKWGHA